MMKTLILSSLLLCCALPAVAQHDIYTLNARGEVVSDSAFIDPFFWKDQRTPYEQIYSETLPVQGFAKPYTIRLYNYENSRVRSRIFLYHRNRIRRPTVLETGSVERMG